MADATRPVTGVVGPATKLAKALHEVYSAALTEHPDHEGHWEITDEDRACLAAVKQAVHQYADWEGDDEALAILAGINL